MRQCIVIFYDGSTPSEQTVENLQVALSPSLTDGFSQAKFVILSEEDIAKQVASYRPPMRSTEEGDASVIAIMGMIPTGLIENRLSLTIFLTKMLVECEHNMDEKHKAFSRAMSYISQGFPVSKAVKSKYHFTKVIEDTIKEVYTNYIHQ